MMLSTYLTRGWAMARSPVSGLTPPLASVASDHGQVAASDQDRALLEIELERLGHPLAHHAEVEHQVRNGPVAVSGDPLGQENRIVDVQRPPAVAAEHRQHPGEPLGKVLAGDQIGRGDRSGVDHRIERTIRGLVQHDRVEGFARRLDADLGQYLLDPAVLEAPVRTPAPWRSTGS